MTKQLKRLNGYTAAVLIVVIVAITVAYLAGPSLGVPEESHSKLVAGIGAVGALVLAWMRGLLSRDQDNNGVPDVLQSGGES